MALPPMANSAVGADGGDEADRARGDGRDQEFVRVPRRRGGRIEPREVLLGAWGKQALSAGGFKRVESTQNTP